MDVLDGFLDSHYSFTASQPIHTDLTDVFFERHITATEREIKLNHLNVLYFTFKIFHRNILSLGWSKIKDNNDNLDEKYILIS
tara:strand:+ start:9885 stop:10133 length:249 start_codon:yes stop_codon:yes gene_type:complete